MHDYAGGIGLRIACRLLDKMKELAARRSLSNLTVGPVLTQTTERTYIHPVISRTGMSIKESTVAYFQVLTTALFVSASEATQRFQCECASLLQNLDVLC